MPPQSPLDEISTDLTRRRYDRVAPLYDLVEAMMERIAFSRWRPLLWSRVQGPRVLEVGVGTGKNFPYYPAHCQVTAIDLSPNMLARARRRAETMSLSIDLQVMDVQALSFPDSIFDTVVSSFVFCSVPDPVRGLREVRRVCRPGGQVLLLEHVLSQKPWMRVMMRLFNPLVVRIVGANIDRDTVGNVERAGLKIVSVADLSGDIVKLIEAKP